MPVFLLEMTFVNSIKHITQIQRDIFTQKSVLNLGFKDYLFTNTNQNRIWYGLFNKYAFKVENSLPHTHPHFLPLKSIYWIHLTKSKFKSTYILFSFDVKESILLLFNNFIWIILTNNLLNIITFLMKYLKNYFRKFNKRIKNQLNF